MTFNANSILLSILVSGVGFVVFEYGRRVVRIPQMVIGVALMVFPYFVPGIVAMAAVGAALIGILWFVLKLGW